MTEDLVQISSEIFVRPENVVAIRLMGDNVIVILSSNAPCPSDYNLEITKMILDRKPKALVNLKIWEAAEPNRKVILNDGFGIVDPCYPHVKIFEGDQQIIYKEFEERSWTPEQGLALASEYGWSELEKRLEAEKLMNNVLDK